MAQEIELHEKGLAQRAAFVEAAQKDIMRQRTLLADAESRIGALEAKVASLEKIKIAAEDAYSTVYSETEARLRTAEEAAYVLYHMSKDALSPHCGRDFR